MNHQDLLQPLIETSLLAGAKIMQIYQNGFDTRQKSDGSAVTDADEAAEKLICDQLAQIAPDIPILAEEAACSGNIPHLGTRFFLVDPLDGTREFVNRTGEFTVNIALIEHGRPVLGVIAAPVLGKIWFGLVGHGAFMQTCDAVDAQLTGEAIAISARPKSDPLVAVASRSHRSADTDTLLTRLGAADFKPAGSSLKFCLLAEGQADVYPRLGRTMEWDTGAGQAILEAAGGRVHVLSGTEELGPLLYGKEERGYDNPYFIAWGA